MMNNGDNDRGTRSRSGRIYKRKGLSLFEVKHRQAHFGPNTVTVKKPASAITRFLSQFTNPLVLLLLLCVMVTAVLAEWLDSAVIIGVVLLNAIVGFIQESKAEKAIESLKKMVSTDITVIREGSQDRIPSTSLVPGDLVLLQSGDKIPGSGERPSGMIIDNSVAECYDNQHDRC
jgi:cation-transporting P-type ATPase F